MMEKHTALISRAMILAEEISKVWGENHALTKQAKKLSLDLSKEASNLIEEIMFKNEKKINWKNIPFHFDK